MADQPISSAAASLGASGLDDLLTFVSDLFIQAKRNRTRILNFVNLSAGSAVAERGSTVSVHISPDVTSRLLTDGSAKVLDDDVGSNVQVTLNKHRYSAFSLTQIAEAMKSGPGVLTMQLESRIASALNGMEEDVMTLASTAFTTNVVNAYNNALIEDDILSAVEKLDDAKAPEDPPRVALLRHDANAYNALAKLAGFNKANERGTGSVEALAGPAYAAGVPWHGLMFFKSQSVPKSGTNTDNLVLARDAIVVAMRPLPAPMSPGVIAQNVVRDGIALQILLQWDGSRLADEMIVHMLYGYAAGREEWGVLLKS